MGAGAGSGCRWGRVRAAAVPPGWLGRWRAAAGGLAAHLGQETAGPTMAASQRHLSEFPGPPNQKKWLTRPSSVGLNPTEMLGSAQMVCCWVPLREGASASGSSADFCDADPRAEGSGGFPPPTSLLRCAQRPRPCDRHACGRRRAMGSARYLGLACHRAVGCHPAPRRQDARLRRTL